MTKITTTETTTTQKVVIRCDAEEGCGTEMFIYHYECATCGKDFCSSHIKSILVESSYSDGPDWTVHLCAKCYPLHYDYVRKYVQKRDELKDELDKKLDVLDEEFNRWKKERRMSS